MKYLHDILLEDLVGIEKDLSLDDKVSLLFLLYSTHPTDNERYEKLLNAVTEESALLVWSKRMVECNNKYWRPTIIEGLCVIQAFHIIEKLGLDVEETKQKFYKKSSSHLKQKTNIFTIHPILKLLYQICEELDEKQRNNLLVYVKEHIDNGSELAKDKAYFELTFSEMIAKNFIKIGNKSTKCDLKLLADFLLDSDQLQHLYGNVKESEEKFNHCLAQKTIELITFPSSTPSPVLLNCSQSVQDVHYKVSKETVGKVLIINQTTFTRSNRKPELPLLEERKGSTADCDALERVFGTFGFTVDIEEDLEKDEIRRYIKQFVQKIDENDDSVFVCILSHGQSGAVYGSDSELLEISEIKKMLATENLKHKPKILILQACQGTDMLRSHDDDEATAFDKVETDASKKIVKAINLTDFLIMQSTVDGYVSLRDTVKGTWFIQSLCQKLDELGDSVDLLNIATATTQLVTKRVHKNMAMVPRFETTFTKQFYFPKRGDAQV